MIRIRNVGSDVLFNIFGGIFTNIGLIEGTVRNAEFGAAATLNNAGTITGEFNNEAGGVLNSTGVINGNLINRSAAAFLRGQLNGSITNFGTATVTLTGTAFDIRSAAADRFSITGNLDATLELSRAISLTVGYSGVVGSNARDHAVRAIVGLRF